MGLFCLYRDHFAHTIRPLFFFTALQTSSKKTLWPQKHLQMKWVVGTCCQLSSSSANLLHLYFKQWEKWQEKKKSTGNSLFSKVSMTTKLSGTCKQYKTPHWEVWVMKSFWKENHPNPSKRKSSTTAAQVAACHCWEVLLVHKHRQDPRRVPIHSIPIFIDLWGFPFLYNFKSQFSSVFIPVENLMAIRKQNFSKVWVSHELFFS